MGGDKAVQNLLSRLHGVKKTGIDQWQARCPAHDDHVASLSVGLNGKRILLHCHAGCDNQAIIRALGLELSDLFLDEATPPKQSPKPKRVITETKMLDGSQGYFDYRNKEGNIVFRSVRYPTEGGGKRFAVYHPHGDGWASGMGEASPILYRLNELVDADSSEPVLIPEGEKHVNALWNKGFIATCNPFGAGKWKDVYSQHLQGRSVVILPDNDVPGRKHGQQVKDALAGVASHVQTIELDGLPEKGDVIDWFDAGHTPEELRALLPEARSPIETARATVHNWLELPDLDVVDVILATVIANEADGDPVWMLIVGAPSSAKSELLRGLGDAEQVYRVSSLTGKTLLSGHKDAGGGLLFRLGDASTLLLLDFGQVLSLHPNDKSLVLQRLREVYDGYTKGDFGNRADGIEWEGKLGFLAGATPAIEKYTSVGAELGDRFMQYALDVPDPKAQAKTAARHAGQETNMRQEIASAFMAVLGAAQDPLAVQVDDHAYDVMESLAVLTTRLRSSVSRNRYTRVVDYLPKPEGPARFVKALVTLGKALAAIRGRNSIQEEELRTLAKVSLDCVPSRRKAVVAALRELGRDKTKQIGIRANVASISTSDILEDLMYLKAVDRWVESDAGNAPFMWKLKEEIVKQWDLAHSIITDVATTLKKQQGGFGGLYNEHKAHSFVFQEELKPSSNEQGVTGNETELAPF